MCIYGFFHIIVGQIQHSQSKKQDIRVDRTYRHKEEGNLTNTELNTITD